MTEWDNIFDPWLWDDAPPKAEEKPQEQKAQAGAVPRFIANLVALCAAAAVLPFLAHLIWIIGQWSWGLLS